MICFAPTESFCYDADGNLLQDGKPTSNCATQDRTYTYTWDGENRLVRVEPVSAQMGSKKLAFTYDYMNRRVRKIVYNYTGGAWGQVADLRFVYDGWNVVLVIKHTDGSPPTDTVVRKYTWGLDLSGTTEPRAQASGSDGIHAAGGIGGLLAVQETAASGSPAYWFLYDGNGNVGQVIKASDQSVAARYEYDPYGNTLVATGDYAGTNPFRFSTKYLDDAVDYAESDANPPAVNLYYYGYRYYSPRLGRWMSRDPIEEEGGANLYEFVANNPTGRIDPTGRLVWVACGPWGPAPPAGWFFVKRKFGWLPGWGWNWMDMYLGFATCSRTCACTLLGVGSVTFTDARILWDARILVWTTTPPPPPVGLPGCRFLVPPPLWWL